MKRIHGFVGNLIGLLIFAALAVGLIALLRNASSGTREPPVSPLYTPTPLALLQSPLATPTALPPVSATPAPTATPVVIPPPPNWPTNQPWPPQPATPVPPTPSLPVPTRSPVPTSVGPRPAQLQALYYMADNNGRSELRAAGIDAVGQKWSDFQAANDGPLGNVWGMYPSPDGKYLAIEAAPTGESESLSIYVLERSSGRTWCPLEKSVGCRGTFWGWISNDRFLFRPVDVPPEGIDPGSVMAMDVAGRYSRLDLPSDPNFSLIHQISPSSDGSNLAYSIAYWENKEQISEIWTMRMDGQNKQRLYKMKGAIHTLQWSPAGNYFLCLYQPNDRNASSALADLKLLNSDGSGDKLLANNIRMAGEWRYRPRWSPDGRYIAFIQVDDAARFLADWREPGVNVYVADTVTGQTTRLSAFNSRSIGFPTWSPDGQFIAFVSSNITGEPREEIGPVYAEVWVAKVDATQLRVVSNAAKWRNALTWLPSISAK